MDLSMIAKDILEIKHYMDCSGEGTYTCNWELKVFYQMWCNTSCGFEGIGGSAMTNAPTYILIDKNENISYVFFNGRFAYKCLFDKKFNDDLIKESIAGAQSWKNRYSPILNK